MKNPTRFQRQKETILGHSPLMYRLPALLNQALVWLLANFKKKLNIILTRAPKRFRRIKFTSPNAV